MKNLKAWKVDISWSWTPSSTRPALASLFCNRGGGGGAISWSLENTFSIKPKSSFTYLSYRLLPCCHLDHRGHRGWPGAHSPHTTITTITDITRCEAANQHRNVPSILVTGWGTMFSTERWPLRPPPTWWPMGASWPRSCSVLTTVPLISERLSVYGEHNAHPQHHQGHGDRVLSRG